MFSVSPFYLKKVEVDLFGVSVLLFMHRHKKVFHIHHHPQQPVNLILWHILQVWHMISWKQGNKTLYTRLVKVQTYMVSNNIGKQEIPGICLFAIGMKASSIRECMWRLLRLYPEHVHSCGTARSGWRLAVAGPYVGQMVDLGFSIHCTCMYQ